MNRKVETPTLKALTQLMRAMAEQQLCSTVSTGLRVILGMGAMDSLCALTVRYDDFLWMSYVAWTKVQGQTYFISYVR